MVKITTSIVNMAADELKPAYRQTLELDSQCRRFGQEVIFLNFIGGDDEPGVDGKKEWKFQ